MGRAYQSSARSLRGVAIGKRGGKKKGQYSRATEGRGKYFTQVTERLSLDIEIQFARMNFLQALMQIKALRVENETSNGGPYLHSVRRISELRSLSIATLKSIQSQLRSDLEEVEKVRSEESFYNHSLFFSTYKTNIFNF